MQKLFKKHKVKLIVIIIICLLAFGILKFFTSQIDQPNVGTITTGKPTATASSYNVSLSPQSYVGKVISFNYPSGLSEKASSPITEPTVENALFTARDIVSWVLAIDVTNTGNQPLSQDSSFIFRQQHPNVYQESSETISGQPVVTMTDKTANGFAEVAFLQHGGYRATVSLLGDDLQGNHPLQSAFEMVLSSWHWR